MVAIQNGHGREQRKDLTQGREKEHFQNSLSLETMNLEECWAAWLGDYFSNPWKAR